MKRQLFITMMMVMLTSIAMHAYDFEVDGMYYNINGDEVAVTSGDNKYTGDVTIPETVSNQGTTYTVTAIGEQAFEYCPDLTGVTIPNTVITIGLRAFMNCHSLASAQLSNSLTTIGNLAFYDCNLTSIDIPNSVTEIGNSAFYSCCLTSVDIPGSVTKIGINAFYGNGIESINIPSSVTTIGRCAFSRCPRLTQIVVDAGNPVYDSRDNCNAIIETSTNKLITGCCNTIIPDGVVTIGQEAFSYSNNLTTINMPNSVASIEQEAFYECRALRNLTIGNSVTSIGQYAFVGCQALIDLVIPDAVTTIGSNAFYGCSALKSVTIGNSVTFMGEKLFGNCNALETINFNAVSCPDFSSTVAARPFNGLNIKTINIGNSVQRVPGRFAQGLTSLTRLTIGSSVAEFGEYAFYDCDALSQLSVSDDNPLFDTRDNCNALIETATNTLVLGLNNSTIPNSVTAIGTGAFQSRKGITEISIPASVT